MISTIALSLALAGQATTTPTVTVAPPPPVVKTMPAPMDTTVEKPPIPPRIVTTPAPAKPLTDAEKAAKQAAESAMFMEMFVKAFDKVLPPQADPDPALLALSKTTVDGFFPAGTYSRLVDHMIDKMAMPAYERIMGMTGDELSAAVGLPITSGKDNANQTFRQMATKDDPMFEARIRAYADAFREETRDVMKVMEPPMREGMARALARKFNGRQLADINAFFATDSGRAFGREWMLTTFDGDVYRGMMRSMPDLMRAAPGMAKRFEAVNAKYPWPKKPEAKPPVATKPSAKPAPKKK